MSELFDLDIFDTTMRLLVAACLGAVIGLDRELRNRPAGLRTHMMTALAAAVFTVMTIELHSEFTRLAPDAAADPIRIIEAVTAGVAFLAAGAIIQARGEVHGLTTGAGMWLAGALGVACGAGRYQIAVTALVLATIILIVLYPLEEALNRKLSGDAGEGGVSKRPEPKKDRTR